VSGTVKGKHFPEIVLSVDSLVGNVLLDVLSYKGIPCALEITHRGYLFRFYPQHEDEEKKLRSLLKLVGKENLEWKKTILFPQDYLNWEKYFKPLYFKKVVVRPPWRKVKTKKKEVIISPGLAFGTGNHPSTRLAISLIEELVKGGEKVLDVGTGSGILSIVALKLGAGEALAIDRDSYAVENAILNGKLNRVSEKFQVERKEASEVEKGDYDIILANLDAFQLKKLVSFFRSLNFSHLVISGIRKGEEREVEGEYKACSFKKEKMLREEEWIALLFKN
jgi:ribosomal protein L11 methyltransferase